VRVLASVVYVLEKRMTEGSRVTALRYCTCGTLVSTQRAAESMVRENELPLTWNATARGKWVAVVNPELSYIITEEVFD
jgi:hypothetical protein